jgi:hypothetical protein
MPHSPHPLILPLTSCLPYHTSHFYMHFPLFFFPSDTTHTDLAAFPHPLAHIQDNGLRLVLSRPLAATLLSAIPFPAFRVPALFLPCLYFLSLSGLGTPPTPLAASPHSHANIQLNMHTPLGARRTATPLLCRSTGSALQHSGVCIGFLCVFV